MRSFVKHARGFGPGRCPSRVGWKRKHRRVPPALTTAGYGQVLPFLSSATEEP